MKETYDYLNDYTGMSQMGDSPKWMELMNSIGSLYQDKGETKVVKFRPAETEDLGEKAKKFKKLFA